MDKLARKHSSDPAQEQLRQAKEDWNAEVKALIALLIPFKQGVNGRGNAKIGIPPSNIKDPLPPQIGHYLNDLAGRFNKVVDDAHKIVDAQNYYSEHRKRTQEVKAAYHPELISEASWFGSRAWARLSLLKKIDRINRKYRLEMSASGADVLKSFKQFEDQILDYKNPENIPDAIRDLAGGSLEFYAVFLKLYAELAAHLTSMNKVIEQPKPQDNSKTQSEKESKQPKDKAPQIPMEGEIVAQPIVSPPEPESGIWEKFQQIYSELVKIEVVVKYLSTPENTAKFQTQDLQAQYDAFLQDLVLLYQLTRQSEPDKDRVKMDQLGLKVVEAYQQLLGEAIKALGPAANFSQLADQIPMPTVEGYTQILDNQYRMQKLAGGAVTRWLNKSMMSINPNNLDRMRIKMAETSKQFRKKLDYVMDLLEIRHVELPEIGKHLSETVKILADLLDQAINLSKYHMITHKAEKSKQHTLVEIKLTDVRALKEIRTNLEHFFKS